MSRFGGWEECLHSIFSTPACRSAASCRYGSSREKTWSIGSADFLKFPEGRRLLPELGTAFQALPRVLVFTALGCLWQLMNGEKVSQNLIPLYAGLQKKLYLTCFLAQFSCFLDYPSDQPFRKFLVMLASCTWCPSSFGKEETVFLQLSQRQKRVCLIKSGKPEAGEMVHSPPSPSLQPLPLAVTKKDLECLCDVGRVNQ